MRYKAVHRNQRQSGVTLLEVLLTLAVATSITILGMQQYQMWKYSADVEQIKYESILIADAASRYYFANCNPAQPSPSPTTAGTLAPSIAVDIKTIDIQTDLVDKEFLEEKLIPKNPLLDTGASGTWRGYKVQFNRQSEAPREVCLTAITSQTAIGPKSVQGCQTRMQIGKTVGWTIQVMAKVKVINQASNIRDLATATCLTSNKGGEMMPCEESGSFAGTCSSAQSTMAEQQAIMDQNTPGSPAYQDAQTAFNNANNTYNSTGCGQATNLNDYVAFVSMPTFPGIPEMQSGLWMTNARLKQFKQEYEASPMTYLTGTSHSPEYQYFWCGN